MSENKIIDDVEAAMLEEAALGEVEMALAPLSDNAARSVLVRAVARLGIRNPCSSAPSTEAARVAPWINKTVAVKVARSQCPQCPVGAPPLTDGKSLCEAHQALSRQRQRLERARAVAQGLCSRCRKTPPPTGRRWCTDCLRSHYEYGKNRAEVIEAQETQAHREPGAKSEPMSREIVEQGIIDALRNGPMDLAAITAKAWGVASLQLQRRAKSVLWAMCHDDVIVKLPDGKYALPATASGLRAV